MNHYLKLSAAGITLIAAVLCIVFVAEEPAAQRVNTQQAQPVREPYRAPTWVTNAQGQRCIRQGETVTCG